jgi:hypothetical protein
MTISRVLIHPIYQHFRNLAIMEKLSTFPATAGRIGYDEVFAAL